MINSSRLSESLPGSIIFFFLFRYGETIYNVSNTMGDIPRMTTSKSADTICEQLNNMVPLDRLPERRAWRDACLTRLALLKKEMNEQKVKY